MPYQNSVFLSKIITGLKYNGGAPIFANHTLIGIYTERSPDLNPDPSIIHISDNYTRFTPICEYRDEIDALLELYRNHRKPE